MPALRSPEVRVQIEPPPKRLNGIGYRLEVIPSSNGVPGGNDKPDRPPEEIASVDDPNSEQRQKLRAMLEKKGNILPETHPFTQTVRTISEKLKVPEGTDFMVLDSEDVEAFYHPDSKTVAFSRGFSRYFMEHGLNLTEDHLASVLAHELEHAHVIGSDPNTDSNLLQRLKNLQNHAEEYRADGDGMRRMSRGGYNPTAMVEVHRTLSLTHGRFGLSHPEQIDRVRNLEDRLADDEHPLSHTTKEQTPLDPELVAWLLAESDFYQDTESLLRSTPDQLKQRLLQTSTQAEFWSAFNVAKHVERVANARSLVAQEGDLINGVMTNLVLYEVFMKGYLFGTDHSVSLGSQTEDLFRQEQANLPEEVKGSVSDVTRTFVNTEPRRVIEAESFRQQVAAVVTDPQVYSSTREQLAIMDDRLKSLLTTVFSSIEGSNIPQATKDQVQKIKDCFDKGELSEEVFLTVFSGMDKTVYQQKFEGYSKDQQEKGLRVGGSSADEYLDLRDVQTRKALMDKLKLEMAVRLVDLPDPAPEVVVHYGNVVSQDTGLESQGAAIVANTVLLGQSADAWDQYLKSQSKDGLVPIIQAVQKFGESSSLHFSPLREFHNSYNRSADNEWYKRKSYAPIDNFAIDASGGELLRMLPARELYLRGYPEGFQLDWNNQLPPSQIKLTLEEWNLVVEGKGTHSAWMERDQWVLERYLEQIKSGNQVDPAIKAQFKEGMWADVTGVLGAADLKVLIEHSPWDEQQLLRKLTAGITGLPHEAATPTERQEILDTLRLAHKFYSEHPFQPLPSDSYFQKVTSPEAIASHMLDVLTQEVESQGISPNLALIRAIQQLTESNIPISYPRLSDKIFNTISQFSDQDYGVVVSYLGQREGLSEPQVELLDIFKLLKEGHSDSPIVTAEVTPNSQQGSQILETYVVNRVPEPKVVETIIAKHQEGAIQWVLENFQPSPRRDVILANLINYAPDNLKHTYVVAAKGNFNNTPDYGLAKKSGRFSFEAYLREAYDPDPGQLEKFKGEGRLATRFDDLLTRRHPFATLPSRLDLVVIGPRDYGYQRIKESYGSGHQRLIAQQLVAIEGSLFNSEIPLSDRINLIQGIVPNSSAVKDIHLEMMMEDELIRAKTGGERIALGRALLPLFTEKSSIREQLATVVLRSEVVARPEVLRDFNIFRELVSFYLPEPSLQRNHFLNQFENSASLTPDQLRVLTEMRVSSEGKRSKEDDAPMTLVIDRMGELNREEKIKASLWFLGLSQEKPKAVLKIEKELSGHLDNLPKAVAASTDTEKEVLFKRFFLGAEGILDLEAVPASQMDLAVNQRREFTSTLAQHLLPDTMPNAALFRDIFSTVTESSDASHSSRTLIKLINKLTEAQVRGEQLPPEEVIAIGLNELGVVGKKVSQSLAELDWVPEEYKRTLRRSQSEGEMVPKRALLVLAEDAGLVDDPASPIRIISFDELIGAASNKQASLLTIEVSDESVGLPKGRHQVVGKFKRPSAQKSENITHDLRVLREITGVLNQRGYAEALPRDFSAQISEAVNKELDFAQEQKFSQEIRTDLDKRNARRRYKVDIPTIYLATDDVLVESKANGISLRNYQDLRAASSEQLLRSGYGALSEKNMNATVVTEALAQLITTGNIHADLHPGNIFVDQQGNLTLIDLGMHERLTSGQRLNTISLVAGLATGNETYVKRTLSSLGWDLGETRLDLRRFNFAENTTQLLRASQRAAAPLPETLASIVLATSKLSTYTQGFSNTELFRMLVEAVDKREAPRILMHLVQSGGRNLLGR